jgi:hypothetical protein
VCNLKICLHGDEEIFNVFLKNLSWVFICPRRSSAPLFTSSRWPVVTPDGGIDAQLSRCFAMTLKPLLLVPGLSLICLLSACAGPEPKSDPSEAWIDLQQPGNTNVLAEKIDGQRVADGRYFEVKPGVHRLDVTLIRGTDGNSAEPICTGRLDYSHFQAGERYQMNASSAGLSASASLVDSHGKQVAQSDRFQCS